MEIFNDCKDFPDVKVVRHKERNDRVLIAQRDFNVGDVILREFSQLTTRNIIGEEFSPLDIVELPLDFQRLVYVWSCLLKKNDEKSKLILEYLSEDGIISEVAQNADPGRMGDYIRGTEMLIKEDFKKKLMQKKSVLVRMINIIETNCFSEPYEEGSNNPVFYSTEEEHVALFLVASMMEHSCLPNAFHKLNYREGNAELVVKCLKPIKCGEEIQISYKDVEFMPFKERKISLGRRGFNCNCVLCEAEKSNDSSSYSCNVSRAFLCNNCSGVIIGNDFLCSSCPSSSLDINECVEKELAIMDSEDLLLEGTAVIFHSILKCLSEASVGSWKDMEDEILKEIITLLPDFIVHPTHYCFYTFIKMNVYENLYGFKHTIDVPKIAFLSFFWLVMMNRIYIARLNNNNNTSSFYSEDYHNNLKSLLKTFDETDDLENDDLEWWTTSPLIPFIKEEVLKCFNEQSFLW
jgi:hypothetical protein